MLKRLMTLLTISLALSSCAEIEKPKGDLCSVNAHRGVLRCYRMNKDYDDNGDRKPNAKPFEKPVGSLMDLNAGIFLDPDSWAEVRRFMGDVREEMGKCQ